MAPLPISHRPLSMDSRDTSMSNSSSRGGNMNSGNNSGNNSTGAGAGNSADSASGYSLPMRRRQGSCGGHRGGGGTTASSTPDSPSTINGTLGASSDYLVPTSNSNNEGTSFTGSTRRKRSLGSPPTTFGGSQDSPLGQAAMVVSRDGAPIELETSFTHSPRRGGGYSTLPQSDPASSNSNPAGRVANKSYGLTGASLAGAGGRLSMSSSTQPLLSSSNEAVSPSVEQQPPLGPLPPTPLDGNSPGTPMAGGGNY